MPFTSRDIDSCIVGATSHPVRIPLHKLTLNQSFVKPGLKSFKAATADVRRLRPLLKLISCSL